MTEKLWPVLRSYRGAESRAVSLPLGGTGAGSVGFGGRGQFPDWELENHPAKGSVAGGTFLACRWSGRGLRPEAFVLEGEMYPEEVEGPLGAGPLAGLRRFQGCVFETAYPYGRAVLDDRDRAAPGSGRGVERLGPWGRGGERPARGRAQGEPPVPALGPPRRRRSCSRSKTWSAIACGCRAQCRGQPAHGRGPAGSRALGHPVRR